MSVNTRDPHPLNAINAHWIAFSAPLPQERPMSLRHLDGAAPERSTDPAPASGPTGS